MAKCKLRVLQEVKTYDQIVTSKINNSSSIGVFSYNSCYQVVFNKPEAGGEEVVISRASRSHTVARAW